MNETEANMENKCPQCGAPLPSGVLAGLCPACLMKQGAAPDTAAQAEAAQFQPPGIEEISRLFPQLEILSLIGKGGMGAVYRARQPALDRIVALKILPPQVATGSNFVERFNREARALAKLNHPNIVAVYEFGLAGGLSYFIMEYVDGVNLRELERAEKLSPREALRIVPQICEALQFAHDEGVVHRDIKPENILLDKKGRVKIADFGIAKILGAEQVDLTGTQAAIGTPHYMAPEQMEKPTAVDHRADIFSLGVVFYEMLTGELPLGKFAPPSTRKVEVDVRLDDVVLRALEKDPELRYQNASQVKTAVDTIAGGAAPPPTSPGVDAGALAQQILARDYTLNIRSCFRRAWSLLKTEFWPFVGITALVLALFGFVGVIGGTSFNHRSEGAVEITSGALGMLVLGPLFGGLCFYFLKKIRREKATVEAAFCGFTKERFLHLFLAGFATSLLTWIGFLCLVLPGIYLLVAWMFALPLAVDKQLDFWSAMELSRKVVTKHWFKLFGMTLFMILLMFAGAVALWVGILVAAPITFLMVIYAYEDIFGSAALAAKPPAIGPGGTAVITPPMAPAPNPAGGKWSMTTKIGLAAVGVVILFILLTPLLHRIERRNERHDLVIESAVPPVPTTSPDAIGTPPEAVEAPAPDVFGPVSEHTLTNLLAIKVASAEVQSLPPNMADMNRGPEKDSAVCDWLERADKDFAFVSAYDGFYGMTRDMTTLKREDWETATPQSIGASLHDSANDVAARFGDASRLNNPTNFTYGFKTRAGLVGLLQITGYTENPSGVKIRYKFFQPATNQDVMAASAGRDLREILSARLEAAGEINGINAKDQALAGIATDAAKAGQVKIVEETVQQMSGLTERDTVIHQAALLLAKRGLRKQAVDLAEEINNMTQRDQTLSELAQ